MEKTTTATEPAAAVDLLPDSGSMQGWSVSEGPEEYGPDDLYMYNNGAAPGYLAYGFEKLARARFAPDDDEYSGIYVDIYDMGSELGAYGIFTSARPPEIEPRDWGDQGYSAGGSAVAIEGSLYIYSYVDIVNERSQQMIESLVEEITDVIPGERTTPWILDVLPPGEFVPGTDRYVAEDLLGHSFLPGGYLAEYAVEEDRATLFLCELETDEAAVEAISALNDYEGRNGRIIADDAGDSLDGFQAEDPGMGYGVVAISGRYVLGMWGAPSIEYAIEKLKELRRAL